MAHVLQGVGRHSESDIMKAQWNGNDYREMDAGQLAFAVEDVEMIRRRVTAAAAQSQRVELASAR